jgi:hypothetical protein
MSPHKVHDFHHQHTSPAHACPDKLHDAHFYNSQYTLLKLRDVHNSTTSAMVAGRGLYAIDAEQLIKIKPTVVVTQVCACLV